MNEFELNDYAGARSLADGIQKNANNIMGIFDDIDGTMNSLFGSNWTSAGADAAHDRYNRLRQNYEAFYEKVVAMKNHVYSVTAAQEEADSQASNIITNV